MQLNFLNILVTFALSIGRFTCLSMKGVKRLFKRGAIEAEKLFP